MSASRGCGRTCLAGAAARAENGRVVRRGLASCVVESVCLGEKPPAELGRGDGVEYSLLVENGGG